MAVFLFQNAISSAVANIVNPWVKDPTLVWVWAGPAIALFVVSILFYGRYRHMNSDEFMTEEALAVNDSGSKNVIEEGGERSTGLDNEKTIVASEKGIAHQ